MELKENNLYIIKRDRYINTMHKILVLELTQTSILWRNMDNNDENHKVRESLKEFHENYKVLEDLGEFLPHIVVDYNKYWSYDAKDLRFNYDLCT